MRVEVAAADAPNRAARGPTGCGPARRKNSSNVPVLVNDTDPDGDDMTLAVVRAAPAGLDVSVAGVAVSVVAHTGAAPLLPFAYEVSDGRGGTTRGSVLVDVIDDDDPNMPPVLTADSDTVVIGSSVAVDVLANDTDPDGDPLTIVGVSQPADASARPSIVGEHGAVHARARSAIATTPTPVSPTRSPTGTATRSPRHQRLDPRASRSPGRRTHVDDSTSTFVNSPVTIDVLRNDGDPGGERPSLVGTPGCPSGGRAVVTADGQVRYDPPPGQVGAFRCTYEVTNSSGLRADASIIISVRAPLLTNEPPIANDDPLTVEVGAVGSLDVTLNDVDPDGPKSELTVVSSTAPTFGTATRRGNTITFTAPPTTGVATINYQVSDAKGGVSTGQFIVTVREKENVAPDRDGEHPHHARPRSAHPVRRAGRRRRSR